MSFTRVSTADKMGLNPAALPDFFARHGDLGIHSLAVVRQGKVLAHSQKIPSWLSS